MSCWGRDDIPKEKSVFVWPSASARANKEGMKTLTFTPGMTEKQVRYQSTRHDVSITLITRC